MAMLTVGSLEKLLERLGADSTDAGWSYEELRLKITKFLDWQGCPGAYVEDLVDMTIDRLAAKIEAGEQVEKIGAYAVAIARFVWLEFSRKHKEDSTDDLTVITVVAVAEPPDDDDSERINCLRRCLVKLDLTEADRGLILSYYDTDNGGKIKEIRRKLAESLGTEQNALRVRMFRLRAKLEACINNCVNNVTKRAEIVTNNTEVANQ